MPEISLAEAAAVAFPAGTPDYVTTSVLETMGPGCGRPVAGDGVQSLTGNPPRPFRAWVGDNAAAFGGLCGRCRARPGWPPDRR